MALRAMVAAGSRTGLGRGFAVSVTQFIRFSIGGEKADVDVEDSGVLFYIVGSLNKDTNWKSLAQKFSSIRFSEPMIKNVLLQLKEPINSRKALSFFHWSSKGMDLEHGLSNYSIMIHILAKARLVKDARVLLESVLNKRFFSDGDSKLFVVLNALIDTYDVTDSVPFVFDLFVQTYAMLRMQNDVFVASKLLFEHGFLLSVISFNTLLHVTEKSGNTDLVWRVYEHMISSRIYPNEVTIRILVDSLCKGGKLEKFLNLVSKMHGKRCSVPSVIANTFLVYEMIEKNMIEEGLKLLRWMLHKNMILDTISCSLIVFAKLKIGNTASALDTHDKMLKRGFTENAFVCSLFIETHCEKGMIDEGIGILEAMENSGLKPTEEAINQLIKGCSSYLPLDTGLLYCKKMVGIQHQQRFVPSCSAVNDMFQKLCENGKTKDADEMLTVLVDKGFKPDEDTYCHLVCGFGKEGKNEMFLKVLYEMKYYSISPSGLALTSIVSRLHSYGKLEAAEKYVEVMKH